MLIPGHIGFTFGAYYFLSKFNDKITLNLHNLCVVAFVALIPDIGDKSLHLLFPLYPDHAIFHSMFLYSTAGLVFIALKKPKSLFVVGILFFHSVLDLVNNGPGLLIYPLTGFFDRVHHYPPVGTKILERLPEMFSMTDFTGHYLLFEIPGLILIVMVSWIAMRRKIQVQTMGTTETKTITSFGRLPEIEKNSRQ
jgi:hypothetical protein